MLGGEINISESLVRYRVGTGISSGMYDVRAPEIRCVGQLPESLAQSLVDLESRRGMMSAGDYEAWKARFELEKDNAEVYFQLIVSRVFIERWRAWRKIRKPQICTPTFLKFLVYLLPRRLGDFCLRILGKIRYG